jgi:hypothetical protein
MQDQSVVSNDYYIAIQWKERSPNPFVQRKERKNRSAKERRKEKNMQKIEHPIMLKRCK